MDIAFEPFWNLEEVEKTQQQLSHSDSDFHSAPKEEDSQSMPFISLERRLPKDSSLKEQYTLFIQEYEALLRILSLHTTTRKQH